MKKDQLTFNDLPTVVGELCDRIASMENHLIRAVGRVIVDQYELKVATRLPLYRFESRHNELSTVIYRYYQAYHCRSIAHATKIRISEGKAKFI